MKMGQNNWIAENLNNPRELERMFRKEPETFKRSFSEAWEQNPASQVLAVWHERLYFKETENPSLQKKSFFSMGILAILAGITSRILFHFVEQNAIAPVNLAFGILPFLAIYFLIHNPASRKVIYTIASLFLISGVYLNLLPIEHKDSILLAYLHLPIILWMLLGLAYTGNDHNKGSARLAFLKFNGDIGILYACMAISGMLLTVLTLQLFRFVGTDITELYFRNVVLVGAAALTIVAAYLVSRDIKLAKNIAPYIAKIFGPLVLATLVGYLIAGIWIGKNPFLDRDFLLTFNGLLLCVLAVTIFSITERGAYEKMNISDFVNVALIGLALIVDVVAVSAIVFRLSSYGISPNRLAVLGINLLIFANLIWIMRSYVRFLQNKSGPVAIQVAVTKYLPVYGLWAALVTFAFPLIW
jgi:hypothetical protein